MIGISTTLISGERSDDVTTFPYSKEKWHLAKLREYSMQTQLSTMRGDGRLSTMRGELEDEDSKRKNSTNQMSSTMAWLAAKYQRKVDTRTTKTKPPEPA